MCVRRSSRVRFLSSERRMHHGAHSVSVAIVVGSLVGAAHEACELAPTELLKERYLAQEFHDTPVPHTCAPRRQWPERSLSHQGFRLSRPRWETLSCGPAEETHSSGTAETPENYHRGFSRSPAFGFAQCSALRSRHSR